MMEERIRDKINQDTADCEIEININRSHSQCYVGR